jgi:hypothetical protein
VAVVVGRGCGGDNERWRWWVGVVLVMVGNDGIGGQSAIMTQVEMNLITRKERR